MRSFARSVALGIALAGLAVGVGACGGGAAKTVAPTLPAANTLAVSKLAQGVDASKEKDGRRRAIELLEQAVKADPQLWEGRYNLGVLLAETGDLVAAEKQLDEANKLA